MQLKTGYFRVILKKNVSQNRKKVKEKGNNLQIIKSQ